MKRAALAAAIVLAAIIIAPEWPPSIRFADAAPTSSGCGSSPTLTGRSNGGSITIGSSGTASCQVLFASGDVPSGASVTCNVARGNSTSRNDTYLTAWGTGGFTFSNDAGASFASGQVYVWTCGVYF